MHAPQVRSDATDGGETGVEGFVAAPIVYTLLRQQWLLQDGGVAALNSGDVRVIATNTELSVWSAVSQPINFALPADAGEPGACVRVVTAISSLQSDALQEAQRSQPVEPAVVAALDYQGALAGYNRAFGGTVTMHRSLRSFVFPSDVRVGLYGGESTLSFNYCADCKADSSQGYCVDAGGSIDYAKLLAGAPCLAVDALALYTGQTGDGSSNTVPCPTGSAGIECRENRYVQAMFVNSYLVPQVHHRSPCEGGELAAMHATTRP